MSPLFHEPHSPIRTWQEVADEFNRRNGLRLTSSGAEIVGRRAIGKLRRLFGVPLNAHKGRANASERSRMSQRSKAGVK